jgi:hypothetical protein
MKGKIVLLLCLVSACCRAHVAADEMSTAANSFLDALNPEQKKKANFEFKSTERPNWFFVPRVRNGLTIKDMNRQQRNLAYALLHTGLSDYGYAKASNIMNLELILKEVEGAKGTMVRDPELYYFSIFGIPEPKGTWGWRVEGHHLSANFTIVNGELFASTPSFLGTNPAEVRQGANKGKRVLADEEDIGRALIKALNEEQRKTAIFESKAPNEVVTSNKQKVTPLATAGLAAANMTAEQKTQLQKLVKVYVDRIRGDLAKTDLARIEKAGWDKIYFAWAGGIEKGDPHYYRVQGPTFLLEYDNTQNDANHIHAVWRDFDNDFGEDLLRQHYKEVPHDK